VVFKPAAVWSFDCEGKVPSDGRAELEAAITAAGDWLGVALGVVACDEVVGDGATVDATAAGVGEGAGDEEELAVLERVGDTVD
jgi:hypothetical protein